MIEKEQFFPIGIGTFRLNIDDKENTLQGLLYSVEKGQNNIVKICNKKCDT